ncbi:MAG: SDR family NAD(P)-dependent oxidoreductase [Pseudomonadales bacterium]|nr:SDR family NAD(P)-dependent oxidoreductase [Pseudomonadales bacterium]
MFDGKTVIVTGGAGVLGVAVVNWFTDRGANVAVLDISDEVLANAWPEPNERHCYLACDLTSRDSCAEAVGKIQRQFSGIDVLCNIAGGFMMGEPVHNTDDQTWDFLFNLNARSVMNMAARVVPVFIAAGSGKIINVGAQAAAGGAALMGAYVASKSVVIRLTESMALELREKGINVNCVMPSLIDTPRNRADMPDADYTRWVTPDDIARVIGFLASDDAAVIHGAAVPVNGLS